MVDKAEREGREGQGRDPACRLGVVHGKGASRASALPRTASRRALAANAAKRPASCVSQNEKTQPDEAPMQTETEASKLESSLASFTGSLERYRHWTRRFVFTPGVKYLADFAQAWWLIDLIASHCRHPRLQGEAFQVWKLNVAPDHSATLLIEDGNDHLLLKLSIHFTDFPLSTVTLWLIDDTLLLPSEY
jgi:hypothetical protein